MTFLRKKKSERRKRRSVSLFFSLFSHNFLLATAVGFVAYTLTQLARRPY
jgi:hypothetical protein